MTDERLDPRRAPTTPEPAWPEDDEPAQPDPADDLHGAMSAMAAGIGGAASGFPAAVVADPDLVTGGDESGDEAEDPGGPEPGRQARRP